jgi:3-hydroxyisobutyrate dehydrogenase-like beta-hydroxyacid dehydrogenase
MSQRPSSIAFIGFGEAAQAFVEGWGEDRAASIVAYDRKTDDQATRASKLADYQRCGVQHRETLAEALAGQELILSVVTADQALKAAEAAAGMMAKGALYCDLNSVAPSTKRAAAAAVRAAGGRYADVAVMSPVRPALADVPLLLSGAEAPAAEAALRGAAFRKVRIVEGDIGAASSIKMIRSVMIKGIEALTAECLLSAVAAGVETEVIASLNGSDPGADWEGRGDYNLDRMLVHGVRRAAEMEEVVKTIDDLGVGGVMSRSTVQRQRQIGELGAATPPDGFAAKAALILERLGATTS